MCRSITCVNCLYFASGCENSLLQWTNTFIHPAVCITTGQYLLPKQVLHGVRSSASVFNFQYPFFSWRSSSSSLRLLLLFPSLLPNLSIFPSCFRRLFLRQRWPIQFFSLHVRYTFLPWVCVILLHFSHYRSNWSFPSFSISTFRNFSSICDLLFEE